MKLKIPYTELELMVASVSAASKIKDNGEKIADIVEANNLAKLSESELDKQIAEEYGISVLEFINSSNYQTIKEKYQENALLKVFNKMKEAYDLTDKEAWSIIYAVTKG